MGKMVVTHTQAFEDDLAVVEIELYGSFLPTDGHADDAPFAPIQESE